MILIKLSSNDSVWSLRTQYHKAEVLSNLHLEFVRSITFNEKRQNLSLSPEFIITYAYVQLQSADGRGEFISYDGEWVMMKCNYKTECNTV